jgi:hypothetical protein
MSLQNENSPNGLLQAPGRTGIHTKALLRALRFVRDENSAADLMFLEHWELSPIPGVAAALRASQLRRANPELAAEIRAEVSAGKRKSS